MSPRNRVARPLLLLPLLMLLVALVGYPHATAEADGVAVLAEEAPVANMRFFREVHDKKFPGTYHALSRLGYNGDFVLLVETDAARNPISDTLLVWVQHHAADKPLAKQAAWADLIVACYPELMLDEDRQRHVLPGARGKIWLYFIKDRYLIITDQRHAPLDFALKDL
jgi:hypothetical protein